MSESSFSAPNNDSTEAQRALEKETRLPLTGWQQEVEQGLELGLEAAESIRDRSIPNFSRGELPHYAGINTFLKAPYLGDVRNVGQYDVAIVGEALYLLKKIVQNAPVCGLEVVEVSPPYDISDITALMATRVICDTMAHYLHQLHQKYCDDKGLVYLQYQTSLYFTELSNSVSRKVISNN